MQQTIEPIGLVLGPRDLERHGAGDATCYELGNSLKEFIGRTNWGPDTVHFVRAYRQEALANQPAGRYIEIYIEVKRDYWAEPVQRAEMIQAAVIAHLDDNYDCRSR